MSYVYNQKKAKPVENPDGVSIKPPPELTLDFLLNQRLSVYVVNNVRPLGNLFIQFPMANGRMRSTVLPRALLPIEITAKFSHATLREDGGNDLRECIESEAVKLVWPSDAKAELGKPEVKEELLRLRQSDFSADNLVVTQQQHGADMPVMLADSSPQAGSQEVGELNPRVLGIVARLQSGDLDVAKTLNEFKLMAEELTDKDLSYIINDVESGKVRDWAKSTLAMYKSGNMMSSPPKVVAPPKTASSKRRGGTVAVPADQDISNDDDTDLSESDRLAEAGRAAAARTQQKF